MPEDLEQVIEQMLDEHLRQRTEAIVQELGGQLKSACAEAATTAADLARAEAAASARTEFATTLAECVRSIRSEDSVTSIAAALVDGASKFSARSILLIHRGDQLLGFRAAGDVTEVQQDAFQRLSVGVSQASAIDQTIRSLGATVAEGGEEQLSPDVVQLLGLTENDRMQLFPVALRDKVLAVLGCDGGPADDNGESAPVLVPAIETLVAVAEAWIEAVGTRRKQSAA